MNIGKWIIKASARGSGLAVEYKAKRIWHKLNWQEYINKVISAYNYLKQDGIKTKSHVGIMSSTRWEWSALDLCLLGSGSVVVPMYPNLSDDDLAYIINHSDITHLIIENEGHSAQVERIKAEFEREIKTILITDINFNSEISADIKNEFFAMCDKVDLKSI
ncbi:MAG: AMP-binding protein, partial [Pseudobdellovibrio sp.]